MVVQAIRNKYAFLRNEPSDQLTELRDSAVRAYVQTKTRSVEAMFGVAMKRYQKRQPSV